MIASAIAYLISAVFVAIGLMMLVATIHGQPSLSAYQTRMGMVLSILCLFAAYGCARLGGI